MRTGTILFFVTLFFFSQNIFSQQTGNTLYNPLSGRFSLNIEGGATYPQTDFPDNQIDYIGQISLDYFFQTSNSGIFGLRGIPAMYF